MPTIEQVIKDAIDRIQQADDEANESVVAFMAGKFDEYWDRKIKEAEARIKAQYEQYQPDTEGGGSRADSGGDAGAVDSGQGGGTGESPSDAT